ncbi:MAG TPA: protein-glutamate O-methyltransferase CheR [Candidatus Binatia bacterium]|jgi:chemotaxis protein methyltransferase CheR
MKAISDREFSLYRKLIYSKAGICLSPTKKAFLEARLNRRIRELGMDSFQAYYQHVTQNQNGNELEQLLDRVSTNETHFFREPRQFDFLEQQILPDWKAEGSSGSRPRRIRVWSAGCSTGEEPYSLAMILLDHFPQGSGWEIEIIATDLSSRALKSARKAVWSIAKAREIPQSYLKRFMRKGTGSQQAYMKAGPEIQAIIRFQHLNLNEDHYTMTGPFDLIFCRNVLIYFDAESRARVVDRLVNYLAPAGFLLVGHAESLSGVSDRIRHVRPTIYIQVAAHHFALSRASGQAGETSAIPCL